MVEVALPHGSDASSIVRKQTPVQTAKDALPRVTCSSRHIRAMFGPFVRSDTLLVIDSSGASVPVPEAQEQCGVRQGREKNSSLSFFSKYDSCYTYIEGSTVSVSLEVKLTEGDQWYTVNISCPLKKAAKMEYDSPTALPGTCTIQRALRVSCGPPDVTNEGCLELGCCYHSQDSACYYRLNACSLDGYFVFSVEATDTEPPVTPGRLLVKDEPDCTPVIITEDTAVFIVSVTDCGTKSENVMLMSLDHTNPPPVTALGTVRVEMRIATDDTFTSFYSEDQLPLTLPLGKPIYIEVFIAQPSPDPSLSLQMRDCFAYPTSRHSVWTLLLDGCPNPQDDMRSSVHENGQLETHSHIRRFDVKTFAFLDPQTGRPSMEEMYFYCWVEICTEDMECAQPCLIDSSKERQKRAVAQWAHRDQLVSWGPLLWSESSVSEHENLPAHHQTTGFQLMYIVLAVGFFLLCAILLTVWYRRRRHFAEDNDS
ncbi:zona pellucida sperm-binding protein 4-like [Aplochiton taeniatus]